MKTINELEQEAQQAREIAQEEFIDAFEFSEESTRKLVDKLILASVAMVTYQFALGMQEVSGDGSGESLPEYIEKKLLSNIAASQDYLTGDGSGKSLPQVSQEERDSDGWIDWGGGDCPIPENLKIEVRLANGYINNGEAGQYRWHHVGNGYDLIAYRIVKGE